MLFNSVMLCFGLGLPKKLTLIRQRGVISGLRLNLDASYSGISNIRRLMDI
jgi:hypothetical protein